MCCVVCAEDVQLAGMTSACEQVAQNQMYGGVTGESVHGTGTHTPVEFFE
jgi:hypothetical protein